MLWLTAGVCARMQSNGQARSILCAMGRERDRQGYCTVLLCSTLLAMQVTCLMQNVAAEAVADAGSTVLAHSGASACRRNMSLSRGQREQGNPTVHTNQNRCGSSPEQRLAKADRPLASTTLPMAASFRCSAHSLLESPTCRHLTVLRPSPDPTRAVYISMIRSCGMPIGNVSRWHGGHRPCRVGHSSQHASDATADLLQDKRVIDVPETRLSFRVHAET